MIQIIGFTEKYSDFSHLVCLPLMYRHNQRIVYTYKGKKKSHGEMLFLIVVLKSWTSQDISCWRIKNFHFKELIYFDIV